MAERLPLGLRLYRRAMAAATPLAPVLLGRRLKRGKEHPERMVERLGEPTLPRPEGSLVWIHGASVGELLAVLSLIEQLRAQDLNVLVTTGTLTSANVAEERLPSGVLHQFIPLDAPRFVFRFLDYWRPNLGLFVESDLWPNLILAASKGRVPLVLVNGRMSEQSFKGWRSVPKTAISLLGKFDLCLAQSALDGDRFQELGARNVHVTGNLKLDVPAPPADEANLQGLKAAIGNRAVIVAASTHPGEEILLIDAHRRLRQRFAGLLTIIVPRHPERGRGILDFAVAAQLRAMLRSHGVLPDAQTDIYIADTMGELGLIYRVAPIVYMGGSLVEHGGQNPIEAVKLGAAIVHGPHVWNFTEIYAALDAARGAAEVENIDQLTDRLGYWLTDSAARKETSVAGQKTVERLGGALKRTMAELEPYLLQLRLEHRPGDA
ncbi:MAG: 3-deoxy-D-manno-octulosonic acid transferase [Pseudorhodoplanes sp.]|nr:3-deoxy-D-manno-octulosonic acid transferase [Pseudorhodoplanes sp.]